jgi:hypothetical protein
MPLFKHLHEMAHRQQVYARQQPCRVHSHRHSRLQSSRNGQRNTIRTTTSMDIRIIRSKRRRDTAMTTYQIRLSDKKYRRELAKTEKQPKYHHYSRRFSRRIRRESDHVITRPLQETLIGAIELNYVIQSIDQWHVSPNAEETTEQANSAVSPANSPIMVNSLMSNMTRGEN